MRWWDSADTALDALSRVDGSDVEQGVGTAVLGLHALAKAALAPLGARTLVDRQQVHEALMEVDYSPVAKALASATEPVMGLASLRYGDMLARELHAQAMAGAQHMVSVLTSNGVPMPLALERTADAVGLPPSYTGAYVSKMKAPAVLPIVRADAADRALMEYAAATGHTESVAKAEIVRPFEPVSKDEVFREAEHPRDGEGRFAQKPGEREPGDRAARMARRKRRVVRHRQIGTRQAPSQADQGSLSALAALLPTERAPEARADAARAPAARAVATPPKPSLAAVARAVTSAVPTIARTSNAHALDSNVLDFGQDEAQVVMVPLDVADRVLSTGVVSAAGLAQLLGSRTGIKTGTVNNARGIEANSPSKGTRLPGLVALSITGRIPVTDTEHVGSSISGVTVHPDAVFEVANASTAAYELLTVHDEVGGDEAQAMYDEDRTFMAHVIRLRLADEGDWPAPIHKAQMEMWDSEGRRHLRSVTRDEDGQFARDGADGGRAARQARRARRERRVQRRPLPAQMPQGTLNDLASLLRTEPARAPESRAAEARAGAARAAAARAPSLREMARAEPPKETARPTAHGQAEASPQERARLEFSRLRAFTVPLGAFTEHFTEELEDHLDRDVVSLILKGEIVEATPTGLEKDARRPTGVRSAIQEWIDFGSNPHDDPLGSIVGPEAKKQADELAAGWEAEYIGTLYGDDDAPEYAMDELMYPADQQVRVVHNTVTGGYDVRVVEYDNPPITIIGEPAAVSAYYRGGTRLLFQKIAEDTGDLADQYHVGREDVADVVAPAVVVRVSLPDDEK